MKYKKKSIKLLISGIVFSGAAFLLCHFRLFGSYIEQYLLQCKLFVFWDRFSSFFEIIFSGVFASCIVSLILSIIDYQTSRSSAYDELYEFLEDYYNTYSKLKPLYFDYPVELSVGYIAECEYNKNAEENNARNGIEVFPLRYDAKNELINYIIENAINKYYADKDLSDEDKKNLAEYELERKTAEMYESIESVITNYIIVSEFKVSRKLNKLYRNFDFMFANKTIRQTIYDNIYTPYWKLYELIADKVYHMKLYKGGRGNLAVVIDMILELQKEIFDIRYNENRHTTGIYEKLVSDTDRMCNVILYYVNNKKSDKQVQEKKQDRLIMSVNRKIYY